MIAVVSYTRTWAFLQYLTELINLSLLEVLSLHQSKAKPKSNYKKRERERESINQSIWSEQSSSRVKRERTAMMSQRSRGACSALRISRISEASRGSWSSTTLTSSSEFWTGMYTLAIGLHAAQKPNPRFGILVQSQFCSANNLLDIKERERTIIGK